MEKKICVCSPSKII